MRTSDLTAWIWAAIPAGIMFLFRELIFLVLRLAYGSPQEVDPRVFFYLPFLSLLPPLMLIALWYSQSIRSGSPRLVWFTRRKLARDFIVGLGISGLGIVVFAASFATLRFYGIPVPDLSTMSRAHHVFFATIGAVVPGIAEEVYFRGFLMQRFVSPNPALRILVTSLSFALWHILTPSYLLHTFLFGLMLGYAYHRTGRLLPVIAAHTLANAGVGILFMAGMLR